VSLLIEQLIFSVEIVDKLALMINKKKASRTIISNELVAIITAASADANNAVATTLTALNSCYAAMASGSEANKITILECIQGFELYGLISGDQDSIKNITAAVSKIKKAQQDAAAYQNVPAATSQSTSDSLSAALANLARTQLEVESKLIANEQAERLSEQAEHKDEPYFKQYEAATEALTKAQAAADKAQQLVDTLTAGKVSGNTADKNQAPVGAQDNLAAAIEMFQNIVASIGFKVIEPDEQTPTSLYFLLDKANKKAKEKYDAALNASGLVNRELAQAQANLISATVMLNSLKAGLAAATAAAMAA
jgi:hypothetical protein